MHPRRVPTLAGSHLIDQTGSQAVREYQEAQSPTGTAQAGTARTPPDGFHLSARDPGRFVALGLPIAGRPRGRRRSRT